MGNCNELQFPPVRMYIYANISQYAENNSFAQNLNYFFPNTYLNYVIVQLYNETENFSIYLSHLIFIVLQIGYL